MIIKIHILRQSWNVWKQEGLWQVWQVYTQTVIYLKHALRQDLVIIGTRVGLIFPRVIFT